MSCTDVLHVAGIVLLASSAACLVAAARAYRVLDIRGAKADLAGIRADSSCLAERRRASPRACRDAPLLPDGPVLRSVPAATPAVDELTTTLESDRARRFRITRKDIVAASDQDMESDRA